MKILIAGAFGNLGAEITKASIQKGHIVIAADKIVKALDGVNETLYEKKLIDVTCSDSLKNLCQGVDIVISTVGLTTSSKTVSHYDIDFHGNVNLLNEAIKAGVKKFIYISVIKVDTDASIPMLDAKNKFEQFLKDSGIDYFIVRPGGYFYDIARVFKPMVEKGKVLLLKGFASKANVIDTSDLAEYILENLSKSKEIIEIGGNETYSYEEIAEMFFHAVKKDVSIQYVPEFMFSVLAFVAKIRNNGKYASIKFGKWTLTQDMEAKTKYGKQSFKQYIEKIQNM